MSSAAERITIRFRGVRGSHPVPGASTVVYGGNTACQEIRVGGRLLIFDAGTGIIRLGYDLAQGGAPVPMALFLSHYHHDHIDGFLYFKPAYRPDSMVHIFGPGGDGSEDMLHAFERVSCPASHPVPFSKMGMKYTAQVLTTGDTVVWRKGAPAPELLQSGPKPAKTDVVVKVLRNSLHPLEGVLNFRLEFGGKSYVYATDVEGDEGAGDAELAAFAKGADLLAHDGQYETEEYQSSHKGWGHSTVEMAIKTARMSGAKRLVIIHHDPASDDECLESMEHAAQKEFPNMFFAREGQEVVL